MAREPNKKTTGLVPYSTQVTVELSRKVLWLVTSNYIFKSRYIDLLKYPFRKFYKVDFK